MKRILLYVGIALLGGAIVGTALLWSVARGVIENPFAPLPSQEEESRAPTDFTEFPEPSLEGIPGVLWPVTRLEWAQGDPPGAHETLSTLSKRQDAVGYLASIALARRALDSDPDASVDHYAQALDLLSTREIYEEYVDALLEADRSDDAIEVLLERITDRSDIDRVLSLGLEDEGVIDALARDGQWELLAEEYMDVTVEDTSARLHVARALWETGAVEEAAGRFGDLLGEGIGDAEWWYARCLEALGSRDEALQIYRDLGEDGAYRAAIILEGRGEKEAAAESFSMAPEPDAQWRGARIWDEMGRTERALPLYLNVSESEGTLWDDAAYRAILLLDEGDARREALIERLEHRPAWMRRLGLEPRFDIRPELVAEKPEYLVRVEAYRESGRTELAELERRIGEDRVGAVGKLYLAERHLEAGEYERAVRWGSALVAARPCPAAYRLSYPRAFRPMVEAASREFDVPEHLLYAVMREESRFRAAVTSWAGAMGLMQVMPDTGREIARRLGEPFEPDDLFQPETSIRFGAWYLREMLDRFGTVDAALAAYNAGPGNAARWLQSPLGLDADTFPTAITFRETRLYVTRVQDSRIIYDWLYGDA